MSPSWRPRSAPRSPGDRLGSAWPACDGQLGADRQSLFAIEPVDALVVDRPALAPKQNVQPPIAVADSNGSQVLQPDPQGCLRITLRSVALRRPFEAGGDASPPLTRRGRRPLVDGRRDRDARRALELMGWSAPSPRFILMGQRLIDETGMSIRNTPRDAAVFGVDIGRTSFTSLGCTARARRCSERRCGVTRSFSSSSAPRLRWWGWRPVRAPSGWRASSRRSGIRSGSSRPSS